MSMIYSSKFEKAFNYMIKNEGGYVFDQNDLGGETKFGISKRSYPTLNIKTLTIEDAKQIYFRDFWLKWNFEKINDDTLATQVFDFSVNLGNRTAVRLVQRALRSQGIIIQEDGIWGAETDSAVSNSDQRILCSTLKSEAAGYYRLIAAKNPSQQKFLNGWLNRAYNQIN